MTKCYSAPVILYYIPMTTKQSEYLSKSIAGFHGLFCETNATMSPPVATPACHLVNNCSTHFNCNSDGSKQCLDGWRGDNCDEIIPGSVADCSYYDCKYGSTKSCCLPKQFGTFLFPSYCIREEKNARCHR